MNSVILSAATVLLKPLLTFISLFVLLRGHNEPGGGFVGGLIAASAFVLQAIAHGVPPARRSLRVRPRLLIAGGLLTAAASGLISVAMGAPFMTGQTYALPVLGWKLSTALLFDIGVYLVVMGAVLHIIFTLVEDAP
ncbi:MAG: Na+/H+ antiporter subunit B [Bryobacteraceae bacterium]|nr:Na+/H+ antiporter subunit B [Bryobacteraceae bacterium]